MAMPMPDDRIPPALALDEEPFDLEALDTATEDRMPEDLPALLDAWDDDNPDDYEPRRAAVMRFQVTDDQVAEWAMAHVAALDANKAMLELQQQAYIERIRAHYAGQQRRVAQRRAFFTAHLVRYAAEFRARDPKRNKTLHLPSGVVKSSEAQPKAAVADEATLIAWVREHMDADDVAEIVKVKESAAVLELRKRVRINRLPAGYEVALECGHVVKVPPTNQVTGEAFLPDQLRADGVVCDECPPDPIEATPPWRRVLMVADWDELVVQSVKGETVAGTEVVPTSVTFTVTPS